MLAFVSKRLRQLSSTKAPGSSVRSKVSRKLESSAIMIEHGAAGCIGRMGSSHTLSVGVAHRSRPVTITSRLSGAP
eukprot:3273450-Rhodomonas_salina.1